MSNDNNLTRFRDKIDEIDDKIISLIKARMEVVLEVGKYKEQIGDRFFIRSVREANMIKSLTKKLDGVIDKRAVCNIWRTLITSANIGEQKLEIFLLNPKKEPNSKAILQNYYANLVNIIEIDDINLFLRQQDKNKSVILAISPNVNNDIWQNILSNNQDLKIFAKIYENFDEKSNNSLFLLANKKIEKSDDDIFVYFDGTNLVEKNEKTAELGFLGVFVSL